MKHVEIIPSSLKGTIKIPPSKSLSHRAVIAGSLCHGKSKIDNLLYSDDITATCEAMKNLGIHMNRIGEALEINGPNHLKVLGREIECLESGSTLRFLIPIALLTGQEVSFHGRGKLVSRPLDAYTKIMNEQNISYDYRGSLPITLKGRLKPGDFYVTGDVSSQYITGLLFVLPLLDGDSRIIITGPLESKGYVDLTMDILNKFSIKVEHEEYKTFHIKGNQKYMPTDYRVEGDYSQAAFWIVAGTLGESTACLDLDQNSSQGDKAVVDIVKAMGGNITLGNHTIITKKAQTHGVTIDAAQCPDIIPVLTVLAALSEGKTEIINAARLRIKESDRLKAITTELNKLGADVSELSEGLVINGTSKLRGGIVESWDDHRIAMALAIASIKCTGPVVIKNSHAVSKSYPGFFQDFRSVGGKFHEWNMG